MKIALIHGYAGQTRMSIFRPPLDQTGGFSAFKTLVQKQQAFAFPWGESVQLSLLASLWPFSYQKIYQTEAQQIVQSELQQRLFQFLDEHEVTTVIAHSLGCRFIYETAKHIGLPGSVKRVIWVQSDVDVSVPIDDVFPELINVWCPWDPTLLCSVVIHQLHMRAGLVPVLGAQNVFHPLWRVSNLHTSSQRDAFLLKLIV